MFAINYDWIFEIEMVYKLVSNHLLITEWKKQENRFQNMLGREGTESFRVLGTVYTVFHLL